MAGKQLGTQQTSSSTKPLLTMQRLIQKVLTHTMSRITGSTVKLKAAELSFEEFRAVSANVQRGTLLAAFSAADRAGMSLFLPEAVIDSLLHGDKDEKKGASLARAITGSLLRICGLREGGVEEPVIVLPKPFLQEERDQVYWTASECTIFQCRTGVHVFYIYCTADLMKYVEKLLNNDALFLEAVRRRILTPEAESTGLDGFDGEKTGTVLQPEAEENVPVRITVKKPLEFLLGSCFLPRQAYVGKKNVSTLFTGGGTEAELDNYRVEDLLCFRFWVEVEKQRYFVYYTVDVKGQQAKYRQFFEKIFKELVRYAAVFLRREVGLDRAGGSIVQPPPPEKYGSALVLDSLINFETNQISCRLIVPLSFFVDYVSRILQPWERTIITVGGITSIPMMLSVNFTLFGKNVDTFYRQSSFLSADPSVAPLTVSEIFAILNDDDSRRLIQNFFLSNGWSLNKIQSMFIYKYYLDEDVKPKIGQDVLFDKEDFTRFFPQAQREDWRECKGAADSYEQMVQLNREALEGIFSALSNDKLILPYKASYMLDNEFRKPMEDHYRKKIEKLRSENRADSALPDIQRNRGQQAISGIPTLQLARALLPEAPTVSQIAKFISKTKRGELEEEIRIQRKKFENGDIPAEAVYQEMLQFTELLESLAVPEEEMVE